MAGTLESLVWWAEGGLDMMEVGTGQWKGHTHRRCEGGGNVKRDQQLA